MISNPFSPGNSLDAPELGFHPAARRGSGVERQIGNPFNQDLSNGCSVLTDSCR